MRCDRCDQNEAVIHLTQVENNEMSTSHLCEGCAAEKGVETGTAADSATTPLTDFLAQMGKSVAPDETPAGGGCPSCGLTLKDFRRTGRLGCGVCYVHYSGYLRTLLTRLHGGAQHAGKIYIPSVTSGEERDAQVVSLRRSLQRAIEAEDFERAAALRDQLRDLEPAP